MLDSLSLCDLITLDEYITSVLIAYFLPDINFDPSCSIGCSKIRTEPTFVNKQLNKMIVLFNRKLLSTWDKKIIRDINFSKFL